MKKTAIASLLLCGIIFAGCRRDSGGPTWDAGLLFPIAHTSLTIDDLLPDSLLQTNPDSTLKLVYENDFFDFTADSLYQIHDTSLSYVAPLLTSSWAPGTVFADVSNNTTYSLPNGIALSSGTIRYGSMHIHMTNQSHGLMEVRLQLPHSFKNGIPLDTTFMVPAGNGTAGPDGTKDADISLVGYDCDFRGLLYDRVNTLVTHYTVKYDTQASTNLVTNSGEAVRMNVDFTNINPSYVRGYFGNNTFDLTGQTDVSFFKKIKGGTLGLESLTMRMDLENNVGVDARLYMNAINSVNTRTGVTVPLNAAFIGNPLNINRAAYSNTWPPVTPYSWSTQLDNNNSNAKALIENLPDKLAYNIKIITNPLGNVSGSNDFFFTDYPMKVKLTAEMPLSFVASNLLLVDTLHPDFSGVKNKEDILSGTLTLYATNSLPFAAAVQLYLLDNAGNITDSIVSLPNSIDAAPVTVNTSGNTVSAGQTASVVHFLVPESKMPDVLNATNMVVHVLFNTSSQPDYVSIYNYNRITLRLTGDFTYRF